MPKARPDKPVMTSANLLTLPDGWYVDRRCQTLLLAVAKNGAARSFVQRIVVRGRRVTRGLGALKRTVNGKKTGWLTLSEARALADANRVEGRKGGDPWADRPAAGKGPTFGELAGEWLKAQAAGWRANTTRRNEGVARNYVLPRFGDRRIADIDRGTVNGALERIESDAARRCAAAIILAVFDRARGQGYIERAPVDAASLRAAVPRLRKNSSEIKHWPAMPYAEVGDFLRELDTSAASDALRMIVYCASRSGEVLGMCFDEVGDVHGMRVWTVPEDRVKMKEPHAVPLSTGAVEVLERRRGATGGTGYVFTRSRADRPMHSTFASGIDLRGATVHGFRSSFRDFATERTDCVDFVLEMCLGHAVGPQVRRSYARSQLLEDKRKPLQAWSDYLDASKPAGGATR